jgi:putative colanic acid biosynthesis acetyltransferase WcaF
MSLPEIKPMSQTDLSSYNNSHFNPGGNIVTRFLWFYTNAILFKTSLLPVNFIKAFLLKVFGAKVGKKVTIKPGVNIKYPWNLSIGNFCWIGENVWIDSLAPIIIGNNVCLSQGAVLLTGSHNYKKTSFDLITESIILKDGVWIGAAAIVNSGVVASSHAMLTSGSVANKNLDAFSIYQGNPAVKIRDRVIE